MRSLLIWSVCCYRGGIVEGGVVGRGEAYITGPPLPFQEGAVWEPSIGVEMVDSVLGGLIFPACGSGS